MRAFLRGRLLLSDLDMVEAQVPGKGDIVDLGCGHGLFSNMMALRSPARQVTGIDLDAGKIRHARRSAAGRRNIAFRQGDFLKSGLPLCDAVTIVDVLYLLPAVEQLRVLGACRRALKPGGVLVLKAQERRPRWKFAITWLQETAATTAGITAGKRGRLFFPSRSEALAALEAAGFIPEVVEMRRRLPYPDVIYIGRT